MVRFYEDTSTRINALIDARMRTDQKFSETNDRLNVLIDVVERFVTNGRNQLARHPLRNLENAAARNNRVGSH